MEWLPGKLSHDKSEVHKNVNSMSVFMLKRRNLKNEKEWDRKNEKVGVGRRDGWMDLYFLYSSDFQTML